MSQDVFHSKYVSLTPAQKTKIQEAKEKRRDEEKAIRHESLANRLEMIRNLPATARQKVGQSTFQEFLKDKLAEDILPSKEPEEPKKPNWEAKSGAIKKPESKKVGGIKVREGTDEGLKDVWGDIKDTWQDAKSSAKDSWGDAKDWWKDSSMKDKVQAGVLGLGLATGVGGVGYGIHHDAEVRRSLVGSAEVVDTQMEPAYTTLVGKVPIFHPASYYVTVRGHNKDGKPVETSIEINQNVYKNLHHGSSVMMKDGNVVIRRKLIKKMNFVLEMFTPSQS